MSIAIGNRLSRCDRLQPQPVSWAAQTALRDIIGQTELTTLLRGRERIEGELQQLIDARTNPWGITVQSVEMRDVVIPHALQDAMPREAQQKLTSQEPGTPQQADVEAGFSRPDGGGGR
jgi:regulator of protease activity HflC (stomatin/prohibitin superfamily)